MGDFDQFKIKEYHHWDLFLDKRQYPYIGRCYAWAKRPNADLITDMNTSELLELFMQVIPSWDDAVKALFTRDRPNVAILGNEAPHLHAHLIPRYSTPRTFHGIEFVDPNPKGNYAPYPKKELPLDVIMTIKDDIRAKL